MYETNRKDIIAAQEGKQEFLEKIIQENNGLVWSIVRRFGGRGHELEDLYQVGSIGFIKAIKRFDTDLEVRLSTYAVPYIMGEIKRFIRDDGPVKISRSLKELKTKINIIEQEYLAKEGKELTINELAKMLKTTKEEIALAQEISNPVTSLEQATYTDNKTDKVISMMEQINNGKDEQEQLANKLLIENLIKGLNKRDKEIIILRYYREKTQAQVAKILGITQVQVSRLEKKILALMKEKLIS